MARIAVIGLVGRSMFFDVPRFHSGGETIHAERFAARQGARVAFLGKVGSESDSLAVSAFCENEGIRPIICHSGPSDLPTACAAILTDGTGETRVTVARGAELDGADVDSGFRDEIAAADFLLLNNEVPEEVNLRASEIAEENGVRVIFNPAPSRPLPDALKRRVFLFTPNEFETAWLEDVRCEVVETLGAKGCRIRSTLMPSFSQKALTASESDSLPTLPRNATRAPCRAANEAAAKSVTVRYVLPSLPRRAALGCR